MGDEIWNVKLPLGTENGDPKHVTEAILKLERKLKNCLYNTPIY